MFRSILVTWMALVGSTPVLASNLNFLRNAPVANFNRADTELFKQTTIATLNEAKDGETRKWANAETGSSGDIEVVRSFEPPGDRCRELQITNRAGGRSSSQRSVFCYDKAGDRWSMRPPAK